MNTKHLTEEELQQYALGLLKDQMIHQHVTECAACKASVGLYQSIFNEVKNVERAEFDFDLAEAVLAHLPQQREAASEKFPVYFALVATCVFIAGLCAIFWEYLSELFSGSRVLIQFSIAAVICTILILQAIDIIKRYQKKMHALDFY